MSTPLVSVVLTNYNGERFVRQAMESVLAQTYTSWEMIVVDDASTDQSVRLIQQVRDPRISLVVNGRNSHVSFSHNAGNALCKGKYIAALDYDDLWKPDKLEKQVAYMEAHPETGACFAYPEIIDENGSPVEDPQTLALFCVENRDRIAWLRELLTEGNHFANDSSLIRREVMEEIGENNLSLIQLHDYDMWVHIALRHELFILPETLISYRRLNDGTSITSAGELNIRQAYFEYSWIIGHTVRDMEDSLFRQVFQQDLLRPDLNTPEATRCEKALYLRRDHDVANTKYLAFEMLSELVQQEASREYLWREFRISQHEIYAMTREIIQADPIVRERLLAYDILKLNDPRNQGPLAPVKRFLMKHPTLLAGVKASRALVSGHPKTAKDFWQNRSQTAENRPAQEASNAEEEEKPEAETDLRPDIRIGIPVILENPSRDALENMIRSILNQTYKEWELCLADYSDSDHAYVQDVCARLAGKDARVIYTRPEKSGNLPEKLDRCASRLSGRWLALMRQEDVLHPSALSEIMEAVSSKAADFVYTDDNFFLSSPGEAGNPHYKPDYAPDTLRSTNYIGRFIAFDRSLTEKAGGLFRPGFEEDPEYDLVLRLTEQAKHIVHIPKVLYSRHAMETAPSSEAREAAKKAISEHLVRAGLKGTVEDGNLPGQYRIRYEIQGNPLISIIIPSREHKTDLQRCLDSIYSRTTYRNFEVILVENGSFTREIHEYYEEIKRKYGVRIVVWKRAFNFSAICNFGFSASRGDYVVLLNNDTEVISPDWLQEMLMYARRKDVGAVGAMLWYPDNTVQHAGIVIGIQEIASHTHKQLPRGSAGYHGRLCCVQNLTAVTGACMMIPRQVYLRLNGYNRDFMVAFNDVDFCLRARKAGYLVVFTPFAELYHHESLSRGSEETAWNHARFVSEIARFHSLWDRELQAGDPYYNPNFSRDMADFQERTGK